MNNSPYLSRPVRTREQVLRDLIKTKELYFIVFDDGKELLAKEWPVVWEWKDIVQAAADGQLDDVFAVFMASISERVNRFWDITVELAEQAVTSRDLADTLFDEYGEVSLPSWIQKHAGDLIVTLREHYEHEGRKFVKGAA